MGAVYGGTKHIRWIYFFCIEDGIDYDPMESDISVWIVPGTLNLEGE